MRLPKPSNSKAASESCWVSLWRFVPRIAHIIQEVPENPPASPVLEVPITTTAFFAPLCTVA